MFDFLNGNYGKFTATIQQYQNQHIGTATFQAAENYFKYATLKLKTKSTAKKPDDNFNSFMTEAVII